MEKINDSQLVLIELRVRPAARQASRSGRIRAGGVKIAACELPASPDDHWPASGERVEVSMMDEWPIFGLPGARKSPESLMERPKWSAEQSSQARPAGRMTSARWTRRSLRSLRSLRSSIGV